MSLFKKAFISASAVPAFNIGVICFLMGIACLKAIAVACFDIGATQLYIEQTGLLSIGFDFIIISFLMFFIGYETRLLQRRKGYGAILLTGALISFLTLFLYGVEQKWTGFFDVLFVSKYLVFSLFSVAFWSVTARFISVRLDSLKFIFVLCAEMAGYAIAGWSAYFFSFGAYGLLYIAFGLFLIFYVSLYVLTLFIPVAREMFISKTGEAQDFSEQKLVRCIFTFSFFVMAARCLMDYVFYAGLMTHFSGYGILKQLGFWWGCFGGIELLFILLLYRTRYFYMLLSSMIILIFSMGLAAYGLMGDQFVFIRTGSLLFILAFSIYFNGYIEALLRPLNLGHKKSINKTRLVLIEPTGFMLGALFVMHLSLLVYQAYTLLVLATLLFIILLLSLRFYSGLLLKSFQIREWRGGPLMLSSFRVLKYIKEHIQSKNPDDVIYFLRILEISKHTLYLKNLLKSVKHPSETVRLFALGKIEKLHNNERYIKTIESVFHKDESVQVRRKALSLLIQINAEIDPQNGAESFLPYLDNRVLKTGAMTGFLKTGTNRALLAMDGLQKLVVSKRVTDNLLALKVMSDAPSTGLIRLLMTLLKSTNILVANEALLAAGCIRHPECLPIILSSLDDLSLRENALIALKSYGIKAFPLIERSLNNPSTPPSRQKTLILFLTMLQSGEGKQILLRALQIGNQKLRKTIIQGMIDTGIFWVHKGKYRLLKEGIFKDAQRISWLTDFMNKYKQPPVPEASDSFSFLTRAMAEEVEETRESILYQLLLLKDNPLLTKAVRILLTDKYASYDLALGVLQDMLRPDLFRVIRMVALLPLEQKKEVIAPAVSVDTAVADVSALILKPPFVLAPWIKTTALYCLRKLGQEEGVQAVIEALKDKNPLVLEAAIWAFVRLEKNQEEMHRILLQVPTSLLVTQSLEQILES